MAILVYGEIAQEVVQAIVDERARQEKLRMEGKFPYTCSTPNGLTDAEKLGVLSEEFGEVAQHVCHWKIPDNYPMNEQQVIEYKRHLREELIQVAAVCMAWAEAL